MSTADGPKEPSRPTVKRLFAVSGNLCGFPKCSTPLVDPQSGAIIGAMCHIKGDKPGSARYDRCQSNEDRHGFANLILLCNVHHKVVDDDEDAYSVERLLQMKQDHESRHAGSPPVDEATAERFVTVAISNSAVHGSVVTGLGQSGGQIAHSIHNYYGASSPDEPIRIEGKLEMAAELELLRAIGCPGLRLTVICRGTRPVKIHSAHLLIEGVDVMRGLQHGFGADMGYTPVPGSTQTLDVTLIPLSRPNSPEGYVLSRDDVARFYYPLPWPPTTLALEAQPEALSVTVRFFDGAERSLLSGQDVKRVLDTLYQTYRERPGELKVRMEFGVRVQTTTLPSVDMIGKVNPNEVSIARRGDDVTPSDPGTEKQ